MEEEDQLTANLTRRECQSYSVSLLTDAHIHGFFS
jgi:hypothetical protein